MSQNAQILTHIKSEPITPMQALNLYGCLRLAARISNLRDQGHVIDTEMVESNGKRYAKYRLRK